MLNLNFLYHVIQHLFNKFLDDNHPLSEIFLLSNFKKVKFFERLQSNVVVEGMRLVKIFTLNIPDTTDLKLTVRIYIKQEKGVKSTYTLKWTFGDKKKKDGLYDTVYTSSPFNCTILEFSKATEGLDDAVELFKLMKKLTLPAAIVDPGKTKSEISN